MPEYKEVNGEVVMVSGSRKDLKSYNEPEEFKN